MEVSRKHENCPEVSYVINGESGPELDTRKERKIR